MNTHSFLLSSHRAQVLRLRKLATEALRRYSLGKDVQLKFIFHGENTTFKITTNKGKSYLLRIHRLDYHTKKGILEELKWLSQLSQKTDIPVQKPILSKNNCFIEEVAVPEVYGTRFCDVLTWVDGKMKKKSASELDFHKVGVLTGKLHRSTDSIKKTKRIYWDSKGLVGVDSKFGNTKEVQAGLTRYKTDFEEIRKILFKKIRHYENKNPSKMCLIHADLHFGNLVWQDGLPVPIDFDDCGYGFKVYDLAVVEFSSMKHLQGLKESDRKKCIDQLHEGYLSQSSLSDSDFKMLPAFLLARKLALLTWMYHRKDNPMLQERFKKSVAPFMKYLKSHI